MLVIVDDRPISFRAILVAMRLAWFMGARVTILFLVIKPPASPASIRSASRVDVAHARTLFHRARRVAHALGIEHTFRFAFGRDAEELVAAALDARPYDLVIERSGVRAGDKPSMRRPLSTDLLLCH